AVAGAVLFHAATGSFQNGTPGDAQWLFLALIVVPGLAGMFIGAPLLARDIEQGTHRLLWTQGVPRRRWLATKLALVFGAVAVAAAPVGAHVAGMVGVPHTPFPGGVAHPP